jgi:hypothetical protein
MNRRTFLLSSTGCVLGSQSSKSSQTIATSFFSSADESKKTNAKASIAIIGGGLGGVAAALGACRAGAQKVILTEETTWIGGQLTSQLVPPDEHQFIEGRNGIPPGCSGTYQELRDQIRKHYRTRREKPLTDFARRIADLNPGNGWVSRLCFEPFVAVSILEKMLQPFVESGQLVIWRKTKPISAEVVGDQVKSVTVESIDGKKAVIEANFFLDATEEGDLLPLTKTEFVTGTESQKETGEPNAADKPRPGNIQSFTYCFILEHRPGESHVIDKPKQYDFWKNQKNNDGSLLFQFELPKLFSFYPLGERDPAQAKSANYWTYRRVIDKKLFKEGSYSGDMSVINCPQNDYALGPTHYGTPEKCAQHREAAKQQSLSFLHWLQTECPRSDGKKGWESLRLSTEQSGTSDGLAMAAYIRESRRIRPLFRVLQQHVSREIRIAEMGKDKARAELFNDSVGIGLYLYIDIHKTCEGYSNGGDSKIFPFQIPLGALIPQRTENLLAACKNLGVTHLTNGCFRLHPIEWNIGESAGILAAFCSAQNLKPKQVRETPKLLADYQNRLSDLGVRLEWPESQLRG